jgi:hypothetical protein
VRCANSDWLISAIRRSAVAALTIEFAGPHHRNPERPARLASQELLKKYPPGTLAFRAIF